MRCGSPPRWSTRSRKTIALWFAAWIHYQRRDHAATLATADRLLALTSEHGFAAWADAGLVLSHVGTRPEAAVLAEVHARLKSRPR